MTERRVKLDEDQYKDLRKIFKKRDTAKSILINLVLELAENRVEEEDEAWERIYALTNADKENDNCTIDWLTRSIVVTPKKEG